MENERILICDRCEVEMQLHDTEFTYLGAKMRHKIYRCPSCGQAYIPEDLVDGKIREVEANLEEK